MPGVSIHPPGQCAGGHLFCRCRFNHAACGCPHRPSNLPPPGEDERALDKAVESGDSGESFGVVLEDLLA